MKLRFLAAGDALVRERNVDGSHFHVGVGQFNRYVGRTHDAKATPTIEGHECDSDTGEGVYLIRECRKGGLLPADKATADVCGVPFAAPKSNSKGDS